MFSTVENDSAPLVDTSMDENGEVIESTPIKPLEQIEGNVTLQISYDTLNEEEKAFIDSLVDNPQKLRQAQEQVANNPKYASMVPLVELADQILNEQINDQIASEFNNENEFPTDEMNHCIK